MKERPILFSGPMVRAILEGRKTQTRRVLNLPAGWSLESRDGDPYTLGSITSSHPKKGKFGAFIRQKIHPSSSKFMTDLVVCPYGKPGDRLWVRESWHIEARRQSESHLNMTVAYKPCSPRAVENGWPQDSKDFDLPVETPIPSPNVPAFGKNGIRWRPSIHMPRWASRITLEITDIRVERLNEISEVDAKAEGIQEYKGPLRWMRYIDAVTNEAAHNSARDAFVSLWESINGAGSWAANPWVWVIEFKRAA